jgi:hypothetical protein
LHTLILPLFVFFFLLNNILASGYLLNWLSGESPYFIASIKLTAKHKGSSDKFFHNLPLKISFSGKTNGLRKETKTLFLMNKIAVMVEYKGFEEFCKKI